MNSGFAYLFAHPETLGASVRHPARFTLLLAIPIFFALARHDFQRHRLALACRITAFVLLVLALAGVELTTRLPIDRLSLVAAVDVSQSIDNEGRKWEERYLDHLSAALAPGDELGVVDFAQDARVVRAPGSPQSLDLEATTVPDTATDIERGLQTAMALFAPDAEHRLILISDGNETRGSAAATLGAAQRSKVTIYAAVPPHAGGPDVAVEKVAVAPLVAEGSVFPVRVVLRNPVQARAGTLTLFFDGEPVSEEAITLQAGLSAVEIPYRMRGPGSHVLRAQITVPDDPVPGNNYREVTVMVGGKIRVLVATVRKQSALATVLGRKDVTVTTILPAQVPARVEDLLGYHCVVFEDTAASGLSPRTLEALEQYVRDFGGAFLMAGGERTYGDAGFKKTPVERLLPVTLEPRRPPRSEREPLALFVLIDRSNSMGYHIVKRTVRSEQESKLAYAKRAALAVVTQLKDNDMVGLIAFDSQPFEVSPLRPLKENRTMLTEDIPRLQPGGGTDFYDALESARKQLVDSRVNTKHVILLTDGDTNRGAADHYPLINALAKADISVTTVRIGDDTVNLTLLHDISSRTEGQFYHVQNVEALPELLLKDTNEAMAHAPRSDEKFVPRAAGVSQILRGLKAHDLPTLTGYAYSRAKSGTEIPLYVLARDKRDPLLGVWQYGLGRVAAFTASVHDDAGNWTSWEGFGKFSSQLVHWMAREHTPWDYALTVHRLDRQTTLTVRSFDDFDDALLLGRIFTADRGMDITFVPHAPREFTARLPALPGGRYPVTIIRRRENQDVIQRTEFVTVPDRDEEPQEEFEVSQPNQSLLQMLTAATGGVVDPPVRTLVGRKPGTRRLERPLDWFLIPASMLLFLIDVGLRRFGIRSP